MNDNCLRCGSRIVIDMPDLHLMTEQEKADWKENGGDVVLLCDCPEGALTKEILTKEARASERERIEAFVKSLSKTELEEITLWRCNKCFKTRLRYLSRCDILRSFGTTMRNCDGKMEEIVFIPKEELIAKIKAMPFTDSKPSTESKEMK